MGETVNVLERWAIGNGGWIRVEAHPASRCPDQIVPPGHVLFVRMAFRSEDAGRLVPIEAFLYRAERKPITASAWRRVKLGRLEEYVKPSRELPGLRQPDRRPGALAA